MSASSSVRRRAGISGPPIEVAWRGTDTPAVAERLIRRVDRGYVAMWPNLFAYQFIFELEAGEPPTTRRVAST